MEIHAVLPSLIGDIYDCAIDAGHWDGTLRRLAEQFDCASAAISLRNPATGEFRNVHDWGMDPGYKRLYVDKYYRLSPASTLNCFGEVDKPTTAMDALGEDDWFASRFYPEWCRPQGLINSALSPIARSAERLGVFSLVRSETKGHFNLKDMAAFATVAPHVRRAVTISDFARAEARDHSPLARAIDLLSVGVFLLDAAGRIAHANKAAEELLDIGSGLRRDRDCLVARDGAVASELKAAIAAGGADGAACASLPIPAKDGDLAAWILPLQAGARRDFGAPYDASVAVFVRRIAGAETPFPGEILVRRYGITPAEVRLMCLLAQGMSAQEAAETLELSAATVKTHLIHVFAKTGARTQAELMRLTMSAIAPVRAAVK